jgi:diguanylate cyclase (GGDEF)-like protein
MKKTAKELSVLLIEDHFEDIEHIKEIMAEGKYKNAELSVAVSLKDGVSRLKNGGIDIVLLSLSLADSNGLASFQKLVHTYPNVPVVVFTDFSDEKLGSEAIRMGAQDYLVKGDINLTVLSNTIRFSIDRHNLKIRTSQLNHYLKNNLDYLNQLIEFSKKITTELNFQSIFDTLKSYVQPLFLSELFSLFILDGAKNQLELVGHNHPEWEGDAKAVIPLKNDGIMWDAVQRKKIISIENFSQTQYRKRNQKKYKNQRVLTVPLISGKSIVGVLNLNNVMMPVIDSGLLAKIKNGIEHLSNALHNHLLFTNTEMLTMTDDLTGLYNHRTIMWQLDNLFSQAKDAGTKLVLLLSDIATIRHVNDVYGHATGDNVIRWAADAIINAGGEKSITGRYYGTQFMTLLPGFMLEQARTVAETVQKTINDKPYRMEKGALLSIPLKIGIAALGEQTASPRDLIVNALGALKQIEGSPELKNIGMHTSVENEREPEDYTVKIYFIEPLQSISVVIDTLIRMEFECYSLSHSDMNKVPGILERNTRHVFFLCVTHSSEEAKALKFITQLQTYSGYKIQTGVFVHNRMDLEVRKKFLEQNAAVIQFSDIQENTLSVLKRILFFFEAKGKRGNIRVEASRDSDALFIFGQNQVVKTRLVNLSVNAFACRIDKKDMFRFTEGTTYGNILLVLKGIRVQVAGKITGYDRQDPFTAVVQILSAISDNNKVHYTEHLSVDLKNKIYNYIKIALKDQLQARLGNTP